MLEKKNSIEALEYEIITLLYKKREYIVNNVHHTPTKYIREVDIKRKFRQ